MHLTRTCVLTAVLALFGGVCPGGGIFADFAPRATAANAPQKESAEDVLARARKLFGEQGPKAALPEFERALQLYREARDARGEAIVLGNLGLCHRALGEYPRALEFFQQSLRMKQELGDRLEVGKTLNNIGLVYWDIADYPQAVDYLTRAIAIAREIEDKQLEAAALNNLSLVFDEQGDYRRSLEQYQRALELHRTLNAEAHESATLGNIGGTHLLLGHYREALRYYQQALAISERLKLAESASQDLGNIALCLAGLGRLPEALQTFDRALALAREAGLKKEEADWLKGKGTVLVRLGRYDEALEIYRQALATYESAELKREWVEGLNDLGALHSLLGDAASAEKQFRRAKEIAAGIGHPRGVWASLIALGDLDWRRKRYAEAAALYTEALEAARQAGDKASEAAGLLQRALTRLSQGRAEDALTDARAALEIARATEARLLEAESLNVAADAERALGRFEAALKSYIAGEEIASALGAPEARWRLAYGRGQALEALGRKEAAATSYRRAVEIIEDVRDQLREERFRAGYLEDRYQVYVALVRLLLELERPDEAFLYAEKLRARSYLDLLNRGLPPVRNDAQRQAEAELRERIRQLQRALEREAAKPRPERRAQAEDAFSSELAAAERAYQNLLDELRRTDPEYAAARALAVPTMRQVQERLPAKTALIEYVLGEQGVSILVLTRQAVQATTVSVRAADLHTRVELLRDLIARARGDEWRAPAESLRRTLLEPIEQAGWLKGIEQLYLVPHGILHYVPFAALPRRDVKGARYLAEDYVLAVLPAAAALVHQRERQAGGSGAGSAGTLLALAPGRARLQFAEQEVRRVAEYFPPEPVVLAGRRATETSFRQLAAGYRVVHLATHGFFNRMNPLFSGVELEDDAQHDGRLEVHEILGLRMNADLVTLSACETALGGGYFTDVPAGDDLVGLTRAFLFAGSRAVLASLWEVNDRSTLALMSDFYAQLRGAANAPASSGQAQALAEAQRKMSKTPGRFQHPYFWAPFILVGAMQ